MTDDEPTPRAFARFMMEHINEALTEWNDKHDKPPAVWWVTFVDELQEDAHEKL